MAGVDVYRFDDDMDHDVGLDRDREVINLGEDIAEEDDSGQLEINTGVENDEQP